MAGAAHEHMRKLGLSGEPERLKAAGRAHGCKHARRQGRGIVTVAYEMLGLVLRHLQARRANEFNLRRVRLEAPGGPEKGVKIFRAPELVR